MTEIKTREGIEAKIAFTEQFIERKKWGMMSWSGK